VDRARRNAAAKRGQKRVIVNLQNAVEMSPKRPEILLALDEALVSLAEIDPRKARVLELRFFGGIEVREQRRHLEFHRKPSCATGDWRVPGSWES